MSESYRPVAPCDAKNHNRLNTPNTTQKAVANALLNLAQVYATNQAEYIEKQLADVTSADESRKHASLGR